MELNNNYETLNLVFLFCIVEKGTVCRHICFAFSLIENQIFLLNNHVILYTHNNKNNNNHYNIFEFQIHPIDCNGYWNSNDW